MKFSSEFGQTFMNNFHIFAKEVLLRILMYTSLALKFS